MTIPERWRDVLELDPSMKPQDPSRRTARCRSPAAGPMR